MDAKYGITDTNFQASASTGHKEEKASANAGPMKLQA